MRIPVSAAVAFVSVFGSIAGIANAAAGADPALAAAVAGEWRPADQKARDQYRHPVEALSFWGLKPGMSILEVQPGGGWWTEILAPYAKATEGKFYMTGADLDDPETSKEARDNRAKTAARFAAKPDIYGKVERRQLGAESGALAGRSSTISFSRRARYMAGSAANTASPWTRRSANSPARSSRAASWPSSSIAANPGKQDPKASDGYVSEDFVIAAAEKAGLKLEARSEINANPKDTKDHPFGVWTLAADAAELGRRGQAFAGRIRSRQVRCDRRVGSDDAEISQGGLSRIVNFAPVAQLDRVLPSEGRGHWFESSRARHSRVLPWHMVAISFRRHG